MTTEVTKHHEVVPGVGEERQAHKLIEATIDTDGNGDGSLTVEFGRRQDALDDDFGRTPFDGAPWLVIGNQSDDAVELDDISGESVDIVVDGSDTQDGTVDARIIAHGPVPSTR